MLCSQEDRKNEHQRGDRSTHCGGSSLGECVGESKGARACSKLAYVKRGLARTKKRSASARVAGPLSDGCIRCGGVAHAERSHARAEDGVELSVLERRRSAQW